MYVVVCIYNKYVESCGYKQDSKPLLQTATTTPGACRADRPPTEEPPRLPLNSPGELPGQDSHFGWMEMSGRCMAMQADVLMCNIWVKQLALSLWIFNDYTLDKLGGTGWNTSISFPKSVATASSSYREGVSVTLLFQGEKWACVDTWSKYQNNMNFQCFRILHCYYRCTMRCLSH